jgi:serine/threonine protein kinase
VVQGDVIDGKYRVEALIGEGGMGRVVAATHLAIGNTVAIKILKKEALATPEVPKRFLREARAAGRLRSEHVVKVVDLGTLPTGEPFMVMEMLHGKDLGQHLEQGGPVPIPFAIECVVQACEGLAEAHSHGMVHRDIKPANLFVTHRPNGAPLVKVLDFGIATAAAGDFDHRLTATQSVMGSPSYMSPEQLKAARDVDARSDIWALGVTLYEVISGKQPFVGASLTALSISIVSDPHRPLVGVPRELVSIIDRCLAKDVSARFSNVAELSAALAPFIPNGNAAAELVAGSLHQLSSSAPLTLHGLEASRSRPVSVSTDPPPISTTQMASGETGTELPIAGGSRRWGWIAGGFVAVAGAVVAVLVLNNAQPDEPGDTLVEPAKQAPLVAPIPEPAPQPMPPPPEPAKVEPGSAAVGKIVEDGSGVAPEPVKPEPEPTKTEPVPEPEPVKKAPVKKKPKRPAKEPSEPKEPKEPKEPIGPANPDPPVKTPCSPSDPTCGL